MNVSHPWRAATRSAALLAAIATLTACGRGALPSERAMYAMACDAIRARPDLPAGAAPQEIARCRLFIGKSAARIDVPILVNGTADYYSVWFRRVARTWEPAGPAYRTAAPPDGAGSMTPAWWPQT